MGEITLILTNIKIFTVVFCCEHSHRKQAACIMYVFPLVAYKRIEIEHEKSTTQRNMNIHLFSTWAQTLLVLSLHMLHMTATHGAYGSWKYWSCH